MYDPLFKKNFKEMMRVLHIKLTLDESEILYYLVIIEQESTGKYISPEINYNF